jgi:hypothetical protein
MTRWDRCRTKSRACGLNVDVGHEHALRRSQTDHTPYESLHLGETDRITLCVPLRLNMDTVEAKPVLIDHTIDSPIACPAELSD